MSEIRRHRWAPSLTIFSGAAILFAIGLGTAAVLSGASIGKRPALCDQYVHTLLTTTDLVEVQRAIFLVNYLDCSVTRRAPEPR
jgi:hypothetical protein